MSPFLVYGLVDPRTNELRYVGKSARGMARPIKHKSPRGRSVRTHNGYWLRRMWADGETLPSILVLQECENEEQAIAHEVLLIAIFREAGFDLTNLTDGGDGVCGYKATPEARAKMAAAKKGTKWPTERRVKMSASITGHKVSVETRAKLSVVLKGRVFSPEHRTRMSVARKGQVISLETRAKLSEAGRRRLITPETCAKLSAASRNQSAETRAKKSLTLMGHKCSPATRAKLVLAWRGRRLAEATPGFFGKA